MNTFRLWPSGLWVSWDAQALSWAPTKEQLQAGGRQQPWLQMDEPKLHWCAVSLSGKQAALELRWLWPWQAWRLHRLCLRFWLAVHGRELTLVCRQLRQQTQSRFLRAAQWPEWQTRGAQLLVRYQALEAHPLEPAAQQALQWLRALQEPEALAHLQQRHCQQVLRRHASLFDTLESHPLTPSQRQACVIDEAANLVLAGAGSGKTSVLVGRAAYLLSAQLARPAEILLLAFGKQAADEMAQRIAQRLPELPAGEPLCATTFHALGLQIIETVEGARPRISPLAEEATQRRALSQEAFEQALDDPNYRGYLLDYLRRYLYPRTDPMLFASRAEYLSKLEAEDLQSLKGEKMVSLAEVEIANWLFRQGIEYGYRVPWPHAKPAPAFCEVVPQFYLPEHGVWIRHLALDRQGKAEPWQDGAGYQQAAESLRQAAASVPLLDTFYWQWASRRLESALAKGLGKLGLHWQPLPEEAVLATLREWGRLDELVVQLDEMLGHYKAGHFDRERLKQQLAQSADPRRAKAALTLLKPLLSAYQAQLSAQKSLDFDDLINRAIDYVTKGRFVPRWRFILVDEFQDISEPRARLIRLLRDRGPQTSLFCVGDDWQAIYRFTGADLSLTTRFADYFGPSAQRVLDTTFRFNSAIGEVANRFVQANPAQLPKTLATREQADGPRVCLCWQRESESKTRGLELMRQILTRISEEAAAAPRRVYLLARFRFSLPDEQQLAHLRQQFPHLGIEAMTIHAAKGKEADQVILCGLSQGRFGLPSQKETHPLIEALLPPAEPFAHAEERRLFYVALTRARQQVYLLADERRPSPFVQELLEGGYPLARMDEPSTRSTHPIPGEKDGVAATPQKMPA